MRPRELWLICLLAAAAFALPSTAARPELPPPALAPLAGPRTDASSAPFVRGRVLARLRDGLGLEDAHRAAEALGYRVLEPLRPLPVYLLAVPLGEEELAVQRLRARQEVAWAELDWLSQAMLVPNDPLYRSAQWNLLRIGMETAWEITRGSDRVIVAVLDTGVDLHHPELATALVGGYDFLNDDPLPEDDSSHGTHTAGVIAAQGNNGQGVAGIAWESRIMPVKVLNARGVGPESAMIKGLTFAVEQGARIVNLSSGTTRASSAMAEAVAFAHRKGALLISAAGNSADRDNAVIYPAAYPEVLAVGATDHADTVPPFSQRHAYVSLVAPGVDIPSTAWEGSGIGRYALATGTSAAAPHVAGLAALIWSLEPSLSNDEVRQLLLDTAEDLGPPGRDTASGYGLISAARALARLRRLPAVTPTLTPVPPPRPAATPAPALPTLAPLPTPAPAARVPSDWYFAEGSTRPPFETWLHLLNPGGEPLEARLTYQLTDGRAEEQRMLVPPRARTSIPVNQVLPEAEFSLRIQADSTLVVERSMFFGHDGHTTAGIPAPATTWYLAEGSSVPPWDTWILLQNPNPRPAAVRLSFFADDGQHRELLQLLPPGSRRSVYVNLLLQAEGFATSITSDAPIVVERAMYADSGQAGHGTVAVTAPAKTWYLAEGATRQGFQTWLVLFNPGEAPAQARVRFIREQGNPVEVEYSLPPRTRLRVNAGEELEEELFGMAIEASAPIVAERVMFFGNEVQGTHASAAVAAPSAEWFLAEGSTRWPFSELVAVLNPNPTVADLEVSALPAGGGESRVLRYRARPLSRLTLDLNRVAPDSEFALRVRATAPVVVERSMYFADGSGGINAPGIAR